MQDDFQINTNGLIARRKISQEEWLQIGEKIGQISRGYMWLVGDWIRLGEDEGYLKRGKLQKACELFNISLQTAKDASYTSRRYALGERRPDLTYSHHQQVASDEDRNELLDWAEQSKATIEELRAEKRRRKRERQPLIGPPLDELLDQQPEIPVDPPKVGASSKSFASDDTSNMSSADVAAFIASADKDDLEDIRRMLWERERVIRKEQLNETYFPYMTPKQIVWLLRQEGMPWSDIASKIAAAGHKNGKRPWSLQALKALYESIPRDNPNTIFYR